MTDRNLPLKTIAVFFSLTLALQARVFASGGFAPYFEGAGQGSMAELVGGLRSGEAADPKAPEPQPGQPAPGGSNELLHFWEDLKEDVFDDICKNVEIPIDQGLGLGGVAGIEGKFKRYMKQYPDNKIAVIDEVRVNLDAGHTFGDVLNLDGNSFNIGLSGAMEGRSVVVRKTNEDKYCKNLLKIADLRKVKTILPLNAGRIREMQVNEIWKFPAILRMAISGGIGYPVQPWASVSFSLGASKELKPSVTLFRMSEDKLRMRIRLDRITVKSAGVSAGTSFDAGMIGLPEAEGFLAKELNKTIVKEFNKYLALKFGLSRSRAKGQKILLEFIIDPRNPAQVDKLADFLKGDLGIIRKLIEMGVQFNDFSDAANTATGQAALDAVGNVAGEELGLNTTFAGSNHFSSESSGFNAMLPIVLHTERSNTQRYDRYQASGSSEVLHVQNASRNESVSNINIPLVGKIFKHNTSQNFYVVNYEDADGAVSDGAMVYQRYEGYIKHDERDARQMVRNMNEILKFAGTQGNGVNGDFVIDADSLFPRLDAAGSAETDEWGRPVVNSKRYKSAIMSFSLVFTKQAVRDIIVAPAAAVMKAVLNVMEGLDREIVGKVFHLFSLNGKGKIDYDWRAARRLLAQYEGYGDDSYNPLAVVNSFCTNAARVIADIAGVAAAGDQKARSKRLSEIMAGGGRSRVGYENMLQIMIQLVNVKDIYAKLDFKTDKRIKDEANIDNTYTMYNGGIGESYDTHFSAATSLRDRFADPSELSD